MAVKLQLACFERAGAPGVEAAARTVDAARTVGLLVLIDGKRGDIGVTAEAYADALYDALGADAITANPLLGRDALEPFLDRGGTFVLVRTSNPGAADLQDLELAGGGTLSDRIASFLLAQASAIRHLVHEFGLRHVLHPPWVGVRRT